MQARVEGVSYLSEGPGLWGSLTGGAVCAGRAASVSTAGVCCSCEAEMISRPSQKGSSTSSVGSRACFEFCFMRSSSHRLMPTQKYCKRRASYTPYVRSQASMLCLSVSTRASFEVRSEADLGRLAPHLP